MQQSNQRPLQSAQAVLTPSLVRIMAIASGITVANLYYIQPLLEQISRNFNVTQVSVGFVAMLTQVGYAIGMLLILPMADTIEKKRLILLMAALAGCSIFIVSRAGNIPTLAAASFAVGFTSIVPQLLLPLAAQLANPKDRGRIIGSVLSGLLIGILVSRTFSGFIGQYFGWRLVYLLATFAMIALFLFLFRFLPKCPPISNMPYRQLMTSIGGVIKKYAALRQASILGAMMFASFSAFWTSLVFLLNTPVYHMGANIAGLFGLVGIGGALFAPIVGRISDKRGPKFSVCIGLVVLIVSYLFFLLAGHQLWALIVGVILLDLGAQAGQVSNQARIQALDDNARNRINAVFMVSYFIGGSLGSFIGSLSFSHFGWIGVCIFGFITQAIAVVFQIRSFHTVDSVEQK
ncbi:MAG TPA: MFS transporter [Ruminococcaceae bacterium]|nr:MFS transporter [Oscillospiraceae bacterium]